MTNKKAIPLCYLKTYYIGSSGVGKSTTRKRLTEEIIDLSSLSEEDRKRHSTFLAECTQVLAIMDPSQSKLTLKVCFNEKQSLVAYLQNKMKSSEESDTTIPATPGEDDFSEQPPEAASMSGFWLKGVENPTADEVPRIEGVTVDEITDVIQGLHSIAATSSEYDESPRNQILLNMADLGGQPGFLEMFPFLSHGPGIFLAFFRLDKDLDEPCIVSYERDGQRIAPYDSIYTFRETLSQILSSIHHYVTFDKDIDLEYLKKYGIDIEAVKPVAALVGTFKDEVQKKITVQALQEKLSTEFAQASESDREEVIKHALAKANSSLAEHDKTSAEVNTVMLSEVRQWLASQSFRSDLEDRVAKEMEGKNTAISTVARHFKDVLHGGKHFFALDNLKGTGDIDPLREHLQSMLLNFSKKNTIKILPSQLLLGVVLREKYGWVSLYNCIRIGKVGLKIEKEEVEFAVFYLSQWVGVLIYHPEIDDQWFKDNIICNPQVIFDSISSLIVKPLLELHSKESKLEFTIADRTDWMDKGQFSLDTVRRCIPKKKEEEISKHKLIPVEKILKLLEHSNLLSVITADKTKHEMYFIPAILECASPKELTKAPSPDADTPSPIKITFETGYVPLGVFCALVSQLVSRGSEGILGMKWELVESGVKRNLVSFRVDAAEHMVTLISHVDCFEVRVIRQDREFTLHELCSYVLSTVLYVMMEINDSICPIIAFDCPQHQSHSSFDQLCRLTPGVHSCFKCSDGKISLTADQECWFAKV